MSSILRWPGSSFVVSVCREYYRLYPVPPLHVPAVNIYCDRPTSHIFRPIPFLLGGYINLWKISTRKGFGHKHDKRVFRELISI